MAIKKSELYSKLWKSCDELRGGMDASQYKDYILVLLFIKYVSDKSKTDKDFLIEVPKGGSFSDMISLKGKAEIGDGINKIIAKLAEVNDLKGVIDVADFNDSDKLGKGRDMIDRLSNLVGIFENSDLDFSKNKAEGDDILGDAYEYLMRHFATESGKSKGQFYTPSEVSRVMAKVISINQAKRQDQTVYDPTCGSGSLLLKAADETEHGITIYGQENDVATRALAKMNMILHGHEMAEIWRGNTISAPYFKEKDGTIKKFDFVVANPPFSTKSWSNGIKPEEDEFERFDIKEWGSVPPTKNGDYAFLLHMIKSLKSTGKAAVILPHGVLFRGNAESDIRTNIIKRGYIKGIVGLPANLFFGTGIPACIIVIDKENAQSRKGIFMIDASKGFYKDGNKNRLRARDVHKIVDVFTKQTEVPKFSRRVPISEISDSKNDYNLNIPRYIDSQETEDLQDIDAHLRGDIPNRDVDDLETYWKVYPSIRKMLFNPSKREGYSVLKIEQSNIKKTIFDHSEFITYSKKIEEAFNDWKKRNLSILKGIKIGSKPKEIIFNLGEDLLNDFSKLELIDRYDIYQHLMLYWEEIMQDDAYIVAVNGWIAKPERIVIETENKKTGQKKITDKGWKCDLIPKELVIDKYFVADKNKIELLQSELESVQNEMQALDEENSGDEDLFTDARSEAGKINKKDLAKRIKEIKEESDDEFKALDKYLKLLENDKEIKDKISLLEIELDKKVLSQYSKLSETEIKTLVVEDKWLLSLHNSVKSEMERVSQKLAERIKELGDRYDISLPKLTSEVEELSKKVDKHLEKMGFKW
ncbi:type I restriction-modification system subunit M [Candidatus Pacearchaeota archaeon]|nr:type I restriction-modification system subunit M [Candidatus Pacearchaeota archaeon]